MSFLAEKRIKIFADCAAPPTILEFAKDPHVSGFTTNATLMRKAGVSDYRAFARHILSEVKEKPISLAVLADDVKEMRRQAEEISSWGKNVYVKIPIMNTRGDSTQELVRTLSLAGIQVNLTGLCTLDQVTIGCAALSGGAPSVISVLAGRIADSGRDPLPLLSAAVSACESADAKIELLWASPRELYNVVQANSIGCHIITLQTEFLQKLPLLGKDLEVSSREAVQMFYQDAQAARYEL